MVVKVAAGIIVRDDLVFVALRSSEQHQGGLWEFPGGKCEVGEEPSHALERELYEECGIEVKQCTPFQVIRHDYSDKSVELHFFEVSDFDGEPHGKEGQPVKWVTRTELTQLCFPEANVPIVEALTQKSSL